MLQNEKKQITENLQILKNSDDAQYCAQGGETLDPLTCNFKLNQTIKPIEVFAQAPVNNRANS